MLKMVGGTYQHCDGVTRRDFVRAGALAFGGLVLMTLGPATGQSTVEGNLYAIAAAVFYSGCLLLTGRLCQVYPAVVVTASLVSGACPRDESGQLRAPAIRSLLCSSASRMSIRTAP